MTTVTPSSCAPPPPQLNSFQQIIASSSGALLTSLMMTPFDVVKTRLQAQKLNSSSLASSSRSTAGAEMASKVSEPLILNTVGKGPYCSRGYYILQNGLMEHICPRHGTQTGIPVPGHLGVGGVEVAGAATMNGETLTSSLLGKRSINPTSSTPASSSLHFTGTFDAFVKIMRLEGLSSLWRGLPPTLVMAIPSTSLYFTAYDQIKDRLEQKYACPGSNSDNLTGRFAPLISGVSARAIASTVISPLELVRTKVQSQHASSPSKSTLAVSRIVLRDAFTQGLSGFTGLWRGLGATLARDLPFSGIYWMGVEATRERLMTMWRESRNNNITGNHNTTNTSCNISEKNAPFVVNFVSGAASGMVAAVLTTPFDVAKTYQQVQIGNSVCTENPHNPVCKQKPTLTVLRLVVAESGLRGLFVGTAARVMKVAPACAIMISSYELGKVFFYERAGLLS
eukprot:Nk52_evm45s359 gene=Nk52_evmTU45s359